MAKVTGFTAERMLEIERSTVVHGAIEDADELVLYTRGGDRIRAGSIKGGTAEWIRDTQPVIEDHNKIIEENRENIQQMHEDIRDATGVIEDLDDRINTDLPAAMDKAQNALDDAVAALQKASNTVKDTIFEYAVSNSDTVAPTSGWSTERPSRSPGQTIWMRTLLTKNNDSPGVYTIPIPLTGDEGDKGAKGDTGAPGVDAVLVRIDSTRGTVFKSNNFNTELIVTIVQGPTQITDIYGLWDHFGQNAYLEWWWRRYDDTDFGRLSASDPRISQAGFSLMVSPEDVDVQTVFQCTLHT